MLQETIVALSTPSGNGAIAVIRLSGENALAVADAIFKGKKLTDQEGHTAHFGRIMDGSVVVDEVVATVFKTPRSYTREDVVEISCHNSTYIIEKILKLCLSAGARLAKAGEFTLRAFLNGGMDLSQAEAVADLIASDSSASHELAMKQMRGKFSDEIKELRKELIHFASLIELELDFSEEDVEFADRQDLKDLVNKLQTPITNLMESFALGNVLKNGVPVVISGKPNVGKSTLLNLLLNDERAIVSDIPGTTRDTIEDEISIKGITFRFIDTAGIRETKDKIEAIGVERTFEQIRKSAIILLVFDPTETDPAELKKNRQTLLELVDGEKTHLITIANKADKPEVREALKPFDLKDQVIPISAKASENIPMLVNALLDAVSHDKVNQESTVVSNARHFHALEETHISLNDVLTGLDQGIEGDFLAVDIKRALHYLGEITGEITNEDLLDNIFSKFCIGK